MMQLYAYASESDWKLHNERAGIVPESFDEKYAFWTAWKWYNLKHSLRLYYEHLRMGKNMNWLFLNYFRWKIEVTATKSKHVYDIYICPHERLGTMKQKRLQFMLYFLKVSLKSIALFSRNHVHRISKKNNKYSFFNFWFERSNFRWKWYMTWNTLLDSIMNI